MPFNVILANGKTNTAEIILGKLHYKLSAFNLFKHRDTTIWKPYMELRMEFLFHKCIHGSIRTGFSKSKIIIKSEVTWKYKKMPKQTINILNNSLLSDRFPISDINVK